MISKQQFQSGLISTFVIFTFLFNVILPAKAQGDFYTSNKIGGGSSVYVFRTSRKANKSNYAPKRKSKAKRTTSQRRQTRRKIVRQSKVVARKNRVRRNIKTVDPQQFEEIKIERKSKEEASVILAGAGEYFVEKDDPEKALGYLEQAIELDENNSDAKLALSEAYTTVGDQSVDKAEEYAVLAAKAVKENNSADVRKYLTLQKFATQKAEREFKRAIELDPKNSSAYASLGDFYDDQDNDTVAKENYEKALALDPDLTEVKAPLGIIYYQEGLIDKAEQYITAAMNEGEKNAETQYFYGLILYKKQDKDQEAKQALETSLALDDDNAEAHYYLGATLTRLGDVERAIEEYKKATSIDPTFVNAWFDLGVAYYNKELYDEAIAAFEKSIKLNSNQSEEEKRIYAESFANLAETYRQTEQYDKAISKYRNAVDLINDPELYSTYGFVLARNERWSDALGMFEKVSVMKPDAVSFANLGWAYYQESQYQLSYRYFDKQKASLLKAKTALQTAIQKDPNLAASYLNLGITLTDLGDYKQAIPVLEKAISMRNDWAFAVNELGIAYRKDGNLKVAVSQFEKAIQMDKKFAYAYYNLGETEFRRGNRKQADKALKELRNINPKLAKDLEEILSREVF